MKAVQSLAGTLALALLGACANQPTPEPPAEPDQTAEVPETRALPPEPVARPFESDTLYSLLVAEIAGSRGRFEVSLSNYAQQAEETGDPQVAERAYRIARYLDKPAEALQSAKIWADNAPHNEEAQAAAILAMIEADQLVAALERTRQATTRDSGSLLRSIAANAQNATDTQRELLLDSYLQLLEDQPDNLALLTGTGLLLEQSGQPEKALELARRALAQSPSDTPALVLASGLLHSLERPDEALELVKEQLNAAPDNTRLRLQYARLLTFKDMAAAQKQFQRLADANPSDTDILQALALVAAERDDHATAERVYRKLVDLNRHTDRAHHYLGQSAEANSDPQEALEHYKKVGPGEHFASALNRIFAIYLSDGDTASASSHYQKMLGYLPDNRDRLTLIYQRQLVQHDYLERAHALLTSALEKTPRHSDLLYSRAMVRDAMDDTGGAERDLRQLIEYDPNNARALNALGYILTERTDRYREALGYIERALELQPDDAPTIDSMGWVQYHLGNLEKAIQYLRRAMELYPDPEIAAHLGEVLWVSGERGKAAAVWNRGLELAPDSAYIHRTLERLGVGGSAL